MAATRKSSGAGTPAMSWRRRLVQSLTAIALLGIAALASGTYRYLSEPGRLPLRVIDVNGEFRQLDREAVEQTVVEAIDGGFFSCDMARLRNAVLAMPWVEDVSIRRVWPDKLSMTVTEEVPLARWGERGLINVNARVFTPPSIEGFEGLVRLSGPAGSEQRVAGFFEAAVPPARARGLTIREVRLDARRHWWILFDGDLTLSLGHEDVARRLAQFFRVYPSLVAEPDHRPERVDMRYAHGFAVRWRQAENPQEKV